MSNLTTTTTTDTCNTLSNKGSRGLLSSCRSLAAAKIFRQNEATFGVMEAHQKRFRFPLSEANVRVFERLVVVLSFGSLVSG
jgi:hypothetical protein